ncbi:MAG TPA: outer membrane beta-barrel protein [Saprospiraceae bacterium]|nr:outer membrane beta-barrel protein [Saprospiraceae bacterium]
MNKSGTPQFVKLATFVSLILLNTHSFSQGTFSGHIGPAIPLGAFADDFDFDTDGAAGLGLGVGVQYVYPLTENSIGLFGGIDIIFNGLNKDIRNEFKDDNPGSTFTFSKYFNIPVSAGVHYTYALNEDLAIYGKLGPTASFLKITKFKWEEPGDADYIETYKFSVTAGVLFGAGVILNDQIEIGLSVMGLGKHNLEGEEDYDGDTDTFEFERKVGLFNLVVGYIFQ